jgi:2-polyprenyl-3-methyl-5-hydroxy-6-metoxy-1,4-benzoquinol methylase
VKELMDYPDCDRDMLFNTYRQFRYSNMLFAGWFVLYTLFLKPRMRDRKRIYSLLDIGFGGGDIAIQLAKWAKADGIGLNITGIELDERALEYVGTIPVPPNIRFRNATTADLLSENRSYDFIISNHMYHHLSETELWNILSEVSRLCRSMTIFNDLERGNLAYFFYAGFSWLFLRRSFMLHDGLLSIKRSYRKRELQEVVPPCWRVSRLIPFRLLLLHEQNERDSCGSVPAV